MYLGVCGCGVWLMGMDRCVCGWQDKRHMIPFKCVGSYELSRLHESLTVEVDHSTVVRISVHTVEKRYMHTIHHWTHKDGLLGTPPETRPLHYITNTERSVSVRTSIKSTAPLSKQMHFDRQSYRHPLAPSNLSSTLIGNESSNTDAAEPSSNSEGCVAAEPSSNSEGNFDSQCCSAGRRQPSATQNVQLEMKLGPLWW